MKVGKRINVTDNIFARLYMEVDGMCPICSEMLMYTKGGRENRNAQAAHIYPHSPSDKEKRLLEGVPRLSSDVEDIKNLILLCPNCHQKFDHPRTKEEYMQLFQLKKQLLDREFAKEYYRDHCIEDDIINVLNAIESIDIESDKRKLSYSAMTVKKKMSYGASNVVIQLVLRNVQDYYIPIREALVQIEQEHPGKSEQIAGEISLFYKTLKGEQMTQDAIYNSITDWLDSKTNRKYSYLAPIITAYYIQNCEVFSE